jgi:hypothetical protein
MHTNTVKPDNAQDWRRAGAVVLEMNEPVKNFLPNDFEKQSSFKNINFGAAGWLQKMPSTPKPCAV